MSQIPFGLKDSRLVSVDQVASGLSCGCVCPECGSRLIARKGEINAHHFAHETSAQVESCRSALETSVHLMAKQILERVGCAQLPKLTVAASGKDYDDNRHSESELVELKRTRRFAKVQLEQWLDGMRPDVIVYSEEGNSLLIEVYVTHKVDKEKVAGIG